MCLKNKFVAGVIGSPTAVAFSSLCARLVCRSMLSLSVDAIFVN